MSAVDRLRDDVAHAHKCGLYAVMVDTDDAEGAVAGWDAAHAAAGRWESECDALRRELDALRQTHAGDLARERERTEAAERECARLSEAMRRQTAAARTLDTLREYLNAYEERVLRSLAGVERAALLAELDEARRERDDWNARATALESERDAALADAAGLRAVAPRTTPPTEAEAAAHNAALGWWLISREGVAPPAAVDAFRGDGDVTAHLPFVRGATWLPLDRDGRPTAWPVAAPDAATQRAGEGGE